MAEKVALETRGELFPFSDMGMEGLHLWAIGNPGGGYDDFEFIEARDELTVTLADGMVVWRGVVEPVPVPAELGGYVMGAPWVQKGLDASLWVRWFGRRQTYFGVLRRPACPLSPPMPQFTASVVTPDPPP